MTIPPKISIIVPVYNVKNYVSKCIESIINQNYKNLEIIIVNDGSTDRSGHICECYSRMDNRIILINQENQGLSMARNNAIDIAQGDYIGFVDSDDWIEADMFSTLYENAVTYNADISVCNFDSIDEVGELKGTYFYNNADDTILVLEGFDKIKNHIHVCNNGVWNKLYKRFLFDSIRFPRGKLFEDIFTTPKLIDKANKVVISSKCKYHYLLRNDSITLGQFNLNKMDIVEAHIETYKYISQKYPPLEKVCRKNIFVTLSQVINKALQDDKIEKYMKVLLKIIDNVRCYDYRDCELSEKQENLLKLLFTDIKAYIFAIKLYNQK